MILDIGIFNTSSPSFKKTRSSEFYEGDWFPWTPLDRSIDSLEPKILGWSWTLEFSIRLLPALKNLGRRNFMREIDFLGPPRIEALIVWNLESLDDLGHLRTPPSSKENTTRNIYSILHENIDCTLFPILCGIFCNYSHWWFEEFFCPVFWAEYFVGVHPWTNAQLFRRSLTLQIGLKKNIPPPLLKFSVENYSKGIWHLRYLWKQKNFFPQTCQSISDI